MLEQRYDYSELKGDIKRRFGTQSAFARAIGISEPTLSLKLNNNAEWSQEEMEATIALLDAEKEKIVVYFFTHAV